MEPSESSEPSYYEVALTNRQVLIAFVALLTCLVAAFFSGVWIGRGDPNEHAAPTTAARATPSPEPQLDQLSFFSGREAGERARATPTLPPTRTPEPTRPAAVEVPVPTATPTPAPRTATPPPTPAPTPVATRAAAPAAQASVFVQVYSSSNGARAREIAAELRKAGFPVVLAEAEAGGGTTYRVRVGPYPSRDQAEQAAVKLRRQHRLDTWVTESP
ncbi:MAG: SPOR domain-containing protein [Acidobacteria bacterium]|nr:SPOR domain-containing protein [Acidobacteriota bacterium]